MNKFGYEQEWEMLIQEMVNEIDRSISQKNDVELTLQYLSDKLGYSVFHTTRKFQELSGIAFRNYLRLRRLAFALADLQDANKAILDIALDYGFSSHEAFSRAFKNVYDMTPSAYKDNPVPVDLRKKIYILDSHLFSTKGINLKPALPGVPKFKCPNFERFVRDNMNSQGMKKSESDEITSEEMASLKYLLHTEDIAEITDITGIDYCVNLQRLLISDWTSGFKKTISHSLSDLTPLQNLTELTSLGIYSCQVKQIDVLSNLTKLQELHLNTRLESAISEIDDISPLQNLPELTDLFLGGIKSRDLNLLIKLKNIKSLTLSRLVDIQPKDWQLLTKFPKLEFLDLPGNQLSDINFLSNLTNLHVLFLNDNQIINIKPLSKLINLESIYLRNNEITDVSLLGGLNRLKRLDIKGNPIRDYTPVAHLVKEPLKPRAGTPVFVDTNLEKLVRDALNKPNGKITSEDMAGLERLTEALRSRLHETEEKMLVTDLTGIEYCVNLELLSLNNCQIDTLEPLSGLVHLKTLHLLGNEKENKYTDLSALKDLTNLDFLYLSAGGIRKLCTTINGFPKLTIFYLSSSQLSNIDSLSGLPSLAHLYLYCGMLSDISAIAKLASLNYLMLECKLLTDITPLSKLVNLEGLTLVSDLLTDISAISHFTKLDFLDLNGSPIIDYTPADHVRELRK